MAGQPISSYGSVEPPKGPEKGTLSGFVTNDDAENRDSRDYALGETYYLRDNSDKKSKFLRALLPILIAIAIVGGVAYFFLQDFDHLYPGHGGHGQSDVAAGGGEVVIDDDASSTSSSVYASEDSAVSSSACSENDGCASLGLDGECCPTIDGVILGCCN